MKSEIPPHSSVSRNGCFSKSWLGISYSLRFSTSRKQAVNSILLLLFHDVVSAACEQPYPASPHTGGRKRTFFPCRCHAFICREIVFCLFSCQKFNIISALFGRQVSALPQKIDSREGLFWCKKGLACARSKMNIYLKKTSFTPLLGLFTAKSGAFWCKMTCVLPQNAARFGAKCSAFWYKIQDVLVQNAVLFAAKCRTISINIRCNGINIAF